MEKTCSKPQPRRTRTRISSGIDLCAGPPARIAPRSSTCISSRTLPGQWCSCKPLASPPCRHRSSAASPGPSAPERTPPAAAGRPCVRAAPAPPAETLQAGGKGPAETSRSSAPLLQRLVRGRDHPHVHPHGLVVAHASAARPHSRKRSILACKRQGHLTDFIQKQCAPVRGLDASRCATAPRP